MSVGKMVFYQNKFTFVLLFWKNDFQIFLLWPKQRWSKSWCISHFDFISLLLKGHLQKFLSLSMATANTIDGVTNLFLYLLDQMSVAKISSHLFYFSNRMIFKSFCYDWGNVEVNPNVSVILILFLCFWEGIHKTSCVSRLLWLTQQLIG